MKGKFYQLWSKAKAVIYDFDGFLVDSEPYHFEAYDIVFREFGHRLDREEYWREFTSKGTGVQGEIDRHHLDIDAAAVVARKSRLFSRFCLEGRIPLQPGARELLDTVRASGRPTILASASRESDIRAVLRNLGAEHYFPRIVGKEEVPEAKPNPRVFQVAAELIGVPPADCLVFEDAEKGLRAAHALGMTCVIARTDQNKNLSFDTADLVVPDLFHLARWVDDRAGPRS